MLGKSENKELISGANERFESVEELSCEEIEMLHWGGGCILEPGSEKVLKGNPGAGIVEILTVFSCLGDFMFPP